MFNELKQKSKRGLIFPMILCAVIAGLIFWQFGPGFLMQLAGPVPMTSLSEEELLGKYVSYDVPYLLDYCSEEVSKNSQTNVERSVNITYLMPFEDYVLMGLEVQQVNYKLADKLLEDTYEVENPQALPVSGYIEEMEEIVAKHFYQTLVEDGIAESMESAKANSAFRPYVLTMDRVHGFPKGTNIFCSVVGIAIVLFMIFCIANTFTGGYQKGVIKTIREAVGEEGLQRANEDCANALAVGNARFGREWTFYTNTMKSKVLRNSEVVWAYQYTVSRRGVRSYYLMLGMQNRSKRQINMPNEAAVKQGLDFYFQNCPQVVLGYDKEIEQKFKRQDPEFDKIAQQQRAPAQSAVEE